MRRLVCWSCCAALACLLAAAGCGTPGGPARGGRLPSTDPAAVAAMEAEMETHEFTLDRFAVDPADYERILRLFEGGTVDQGPRAAWVHLGFIRIKYKDGQRSVVHLFRTFREEGAYYIGDTRYRGSTDEAIITAIKESHKRSQQGPGR
jgi:hypothetical protein